MEAHGEKRSTAEGKAMTIITVQVTIVPGKARVSK